MEHFLPFYSSQGGRDTSHPNPALAADTAARALFTCMEKFLSEQMTRCKIGATMKAILVEEPSPKV